MSINAHIFFSVNDTGRQAACQYQKGNRFRLRHENNIVVTVVSKCWNSCYIFNGLQNSCGMPIPQQTSSKPIKISRCSERRQISRSAFIFRISVKQKKTCSRSNMRRKKHTDCVRKITPCTTLTFRHRASSIQDRRFATLQRTLFIYFINKYISLSDICLTVHH